MDRIEFPMTAEGLITASKCAATLEGILCNASESCPENPSGLTDEEADLLEAAETYAHAQAVREATRATLLTAARARVLEARA